MIIISWWHLCVEQKEYLVTENCNRDEMDFYLCDAEVNVAEDAMMFIWMWCNVSDTYINEREQI